MRCVLDNFSQNVNELEEKEVEESVSGSPEIEDIQFEDAIDVEKLLKTLQENPEIKAPLEPAVSVKSEFPILTKDKNSKKYVIYVNYENIEFMESLSIPERRDLINKILKEQNEIAIKKKESEARIRNVINWVLAFVTVTVSLPIIFIMVNKATEITVVNYGQSKANFTRLYREKGKIQQVNSTPSGNLKY